MPRPLRIEYEGAFYHVMNRGRGRQTIFPGGAYYQDFLTTLAEAHGRFGLEIHAYCLMGNHYHLLVRTPRANLSRSMRHVNGLYTQRHNRRAETDGPLFRGRFKAVLVDSDNYLLRLSRYIHRNPMATKKPRVRQLASYPWSSYPAYLNVAPAPPWLYRDETYTLLGHRHRFAQYKVYVEDGDDDELTEFYSRDRWAPVLGDDAFTDKVARQDWQNISEAKLKTRIHGPPGVERILEAVSRSFKVERAALFSSQRGQRNEARWVAMTLCQDVGGQPLTSIANLFGLRHMSGVSHLIRRLRQELKQNDRLRRRVNMLIQELTP